MAKALALAKPNGRVALVQPASTLLYNSTAPSCELRDRVFQEFRVEEVINFAALRYLIFTNAIMPACAIVVRNASSDGEPLWYSCPKPLHTQEDRYHVVIEPNDIHKIYPHEIKSAPWVWTALMWGGRRDLAFLNRMSQYISLDKLENAGLVKARDGIIRGTVSKEYTEILNRPILNAKDFPADDSLYLDAATLHLNTDPRVNSVNSHDFSVFDLPQLIFKQSYMKSVLRFRAAIVKSNDKLGGVICPNSFASVHLECEDQAVLETICLVFNSTVALYHLLLTSGRFAMDRNEPQLENFRSIPLPEPQQGVLAGVNSICDVDERARQVFDFKESEWILIDDLVQFTLPDYKRGAGSPGRQPTRRNTIGKINLAAEPELTAYCHTLRQVLQAGFGMDKQIGAVIFSEPDQQRLPVRMVSIYLNVSDASSVCVEEMNAPLLRERLTKMYLDLLDTRNVKSFYQRTIRTYDKDGRGIVVNVIKPDQTRYWTRSMAMRDADEIVADFVLWQNVQETQPANEVIRG